MDDCLFCKIVANQIPSARVYEDESKLAFMDIGPIRPGHVLLIPKTHYERFTDLPPEVAADLAKVLPALSAAVVRTAGAHGFNLFQTNGRCSGQVVPHVHIHIIPRRENDGASLAWKAGSYGPDELESWRRKIADALEGV